jgi:hypothetical protein
MLDGLKAQTLAHADWELLVVDNGSARRLADSYDLSWHPHHQQLREETPGLMAARACGIRAAAGALVVFVDDDNLLAADYLRRCIDIAAAAPKLAAFGAGVLAAEFETAPSASVQHWLPMLGIRHVDHVHWSNNPDDSASIPWGAGLCVRRTTGVAYAQFVEEIEGAAHLDRCGDRLFSGGDDLFSWLAAATSQGFGVFPTLRLTHMLRAERLRPAYLLRLIHDHAYSHAILRVMTGGSQPSRFGVPDMVRILLHGVRRGVFSMQAQWAAARGMAAAARYVADHGVRNLSALTSRRSGHPAGSCELSAASS